LNCGREGTYFCEDCQACVEISEDDFCLCEKPKLIAEIGKCKNCQAKELDGLYFAVSYQNKIIKRLIKQFSSEPYIKELAGPLTNLIITYFLLSKKSEKSWKNKILVPFPLPKKEMKRIGFSPAEEIAKHLSNAMKIPCLNIAEKEGLKDKNILLVNDIYTDGKGMNEAARILKEAGAIKVEGITIARELID